MPENFVVVIPARLNSTRLPNKPLYKIKNKPLIIWTIESLLEFLPENKIIVACDSEEIKKVILEYYPQIRVMLTPDTIKSGTERVAFVAVDLEDENIDFIINVQCDEPLIKEKHIFALLEELKKGESFVTLGTKFKSAEEIFNPNNVKIVLDKNSYALYFSRSFIPFVRDIISYDLQSIQDKLFINYSLDITKLDLEKFIKHVGIYGYEIEKLIEFSEWEEGNLEKIEKLEQLRILENGEKIKVRVFNDTFIGIDTEEDVKKFEAYLNY